ncbi:long-chain-fatty-acid--CoA ligase [Mycobacterium sp. CBMA271]|uniref:long-chain-fatty-acid--CoA ligase n=1 Tax=unclassified Mycobacteroides TaxID=2618759 RepID=UPI0012DEFA0A|nr:MULTISPECIES: long-chain-fatty-acid--CoA ligase [unclassified Mycobacteroides]MUM19152.1 fatty-acid--CoA ligase [Mycobacteroides sp. CBMA 326]MUM21566.1 long-chain-fatty-acid--CoA ligase [Mycobacteroides sp. CBMA 271]
MQFTQWLHRALQQDPNRPITIHQGRQHSVEQFADRVARLAGGLRDLGVQPGDRVGMLSLNSDRYIEYLSAVPWLGAALNAVNIRWSLAEIGYSLRESDTRVLLVDDAFKAAPEPLRAACACLTTVIHCGDGPTPEGAIGYEDLIAAHDPVEDTRAGGDSLLGVFYTGGTTGNPKGVMLSHNNVLASAMGSLSTGNFLTRGGRLLHSAPMFHMADFTSVLAGNLSNVTHVILPSFTPQGVLDAIVEHDVQDMLLVPTMIQMVVDHPAAVQLDLSGIHHIAYGASVISEAVLQRAQRVFPNVRFTQAYGMTEVSPVATLLLPDDHDDPSLLRSAGRAAPHCEVRIVDPDDNEVPRGEIGEVVVKGDNVMLGYWELPDETASAIRSGWMHTGDAGRMDERGYVYIVDRIKDMVVTGGENVYSAEVENALAKHPAVAACAVIGVPDERWGERVHAVIVKQSESDCCGDDLQEHCREHIANYKVPRSFEFVDELPLSGAGKILKRVLRQKYWDTRDAGVS